MGEGRDREHELLKREDGKPAGQDDRGCTRAEEKGQADKLIYVWGVALIELLMVWTYTVRERRTQENS